MVIVRVPVAGKEPQDHVQIVKIAGFSVFVLSAGFFVNFVNQVRLTDQFIVNSIAVQPEGSSELSPT
jgi:hypothetical protein